MNHSGRRSTSAAQAARETEPTNSQEMMPPPGPLAAKAISHCSEEVTVLKAAKIIERVKEVQSLEALAESLIRFANQQATGQQLINAPAIDRKVFKALGAIIATYVETTDKEREEAIIWSCKEAKKEATKEAMRELMREEISNMVQGELASIMKGELAKVHEAQQDAHQSIRECQKEVQDARKEQQSMEFPPLSARPFSYSAVTAAGVSAAAHPSLVARKVTQGRQVILKFAGEGQIMERQLSAQDVLKAIQSEVDGLDDGIGAKVRLATRNLKRMDIVIEMATDEGARWIKENGRVSTLATKLGAAVKERAYAVLVKFVPTTFDHENQKDMEELREANDLEKGNLISIRPIKPVNRRSVGQASAHYIASFSSATTANRAIFNGLVIHNEERKVEKLKSEPLRCLKCQTYGHLAKDCSEKDDRCATCAQTGHRSAACTVTQASERRCVTCDQKGHASWERTCPAFTKRCEDLDKKHLENSLPYFPSDEPWTWLPTPSPPNHTQGGAHQGSPLPGPPPPINFRRGTQRERRQDNGWPNERTRGDTEQGGRRDWADDDRQWTPGPSYIDHRNYDYSQDRRGPGL